VDGDLAADVVEREDTVVGHVVLAAIIIVGDVGGAVVGRIDV
jgi:hypothetical protein